MSIPSAPAAQQRAHALSVLLARYIAGDDASDHFFDASDLFEDASASADERAAFARFYLDVLDEDGAVRMPKADELSDLLNVARA